jgi:hypothetical protein
VELRIALPAAALPSPPLPRIVKSLDVVEDIGSSLAKQKIMQLQSFPRFKNTELALTYLRLGQIITANHETPWEQKREHYA